MFKSADVAFVYIYNINRHFISVYYEKVFSHLFLALEAKYYIFNEWVSVSFSFYRISNGNWDEMRCRCCGFDAEQKQRWFITHILWAGGRRAVAQYTVYIC